GGKQEPIIVGPHGTWKLAESPRNVDKTAVAIGSRCAWIGRFGVDLVASGQRGAPTVIIECTGKVVGVGGPVALGAIVRIVEMQLRLIATEAAVICTIDRQSVVDPGQNGFTVAALDQERRQGPRHKPARAERPDTGRVLRRKIRMEPGIRRDLPQRHHIADLWEKLVPALMCEDLSRRAALDRT